MDQEIGFCTTSDGVNIAYATLGEGPPLVYVTGWPGHLSLEWETPVARHLIEELAEGATLIRYDMRGSGLSDRDVGELSLERWIEDLAAVVDHLKLDQFALLSLGLLAGPIAMAYAAEHPERVTTLILSSAFLRGSELSTPERSKTMTDYISAYGFPLSMDEDLDQEDLKKFQDVARLQKRSASTEVQGAVVRAMFSANSEKLTERLTMPTLLLHGQSDTVVPFDLGRKLAARLPNAKFVPFLESSAAPWQQGIIVEEIRRFLQVDAPADDHAKVATAGGPVTILFTDMESSTALTQRLGDAKAQELVRAHNTIVREGLQAHGGTEIKHTGDGIMASFPATSGALECAIAIQRGLAALRQAQADQAEPLEATLNVRIGLNAGEPVAEEDDLFGTAVQFAARICDHAEPGQILTSDVVRQLVAGKDFLFSDRGEVALRGFEDPVRLYEVRWREDDAG